MSLSFEYVYESVVLKKTHNSNCGCESSLRFESWTKYQGLSVAPTRRPLQTCVGRCCTVQEPVNLRAQTEWPFDFFSEQIPPQIPVHMSQKRARWPSIENTFSENSPSFSIHGHNRNAKTGPSPSRSPLSPHSISVNSLDLSKRCVTAPSHFPF